MSSSKGIAIIILLALLIIIVNAAPASGTILGWLKKIGYVEFPEYKLPPGYFSDETTNTTPAPKDFNFQYQLINTSSNQGLPYGQINYDAKLIKFYGDGRTETIIESLRNRFGNILNQPNQILAQYYFPPNSDNIYFNFKNEYTSGVSNRYHIYRYNVKTDQMASLYSNRNLTNYAIPSPYNPTLIAAVDDDLTRTYQKLYIVNIGNDNAILLKQLQGDETLATTPFVATQNPSADIIWTGSNKILYGVYKKNNSGSYEFMERRTATF